MITQQKISKFIKVNNSLGLHTRPATAIVRILQQRKSSVSFTYNGEMVNARSILSILMLAAERDAQILVSVEGADAIETMDELERGFATCFGEE